MHYALTPLEVQTQVPRLLNQLRMFERFLSGAPGYLSSGHAAQEPGGKTQLGVKFKLSSLSRPEISHLHMSATLDPDGANTRLRYVRHRGARVRDGRVRRVIRRVRATHERCVPRCGVSTSQNDVRLACEIGGLTFGLLFSSLS